MGVPTIDLIAENVGPTGGYAFIVITGTNFKLPDPVSSTGPTTVPSPPVSVTFNGEPAVRIVVKDATELWVLTPPFHGIATEDPIPPVPVTVTNLDSNGDPISGETVTETLGYTYRRPVLHNTQGNTTASPHPFALVSAALILALRRQVFMNVVQTTHVDYAEPGMLTMQVAKLPALVVQGPNVVRDLEYTHNEVDIVDLGGGISALRQPPDVVRMGYTFFCVTDNEKELLNIMGSFQLFFMKNKYLGVQIDPLDSSKGVASLVMQMTQYPQATATPSDNNLRVWVASAEMRGVEIHLDEAFDNTYDVTELDLEVQRITG